MATTPAFWLGFPFPLNTGKDYKNPYSEFGLPDLELVPIRVSTTVSRYFPAYAGTTVGTSRGRSTRMVAVSDFSGLVSSACALASAAAIAPMVSLDRCIARLHVEEIETDRPRFGPPGADAMTENGTTVDFDVDLF